MIVDSPRHEPKGAIVVGKYRSFAARLSDWFNSHRMNPVADLWLGPSLGEWKSTPL